MKIKIIDLLNYVARGENIPKKIKYRDEIWEYTSTVFGKCYQYYSDYLREWKRLEDVIVLEECLNDEVEIIKEKKKIEEILISMDDNSMPFVGDKQYKHLSYAEVDLMFANKINELIDEVNKLKESE